MTLLKKPNPHNLTVRQSCRDLELLRFVGRHGVVSIAHVMAAMGAGRTATYRRVAACVDAGLLERLELVRSEPGLLRATRDGLRYVGLGLPVAVVSPGAVGHWLRCASTAHLLGERYGHDRILTEREILLAELIEGRPIASAEVGTLPSGAPRMHRADLAVLPDGHPLLSWPGDATTLAAHPRTRERGREIAGGDGRGERSRTREGERKISSRDECARPGAEEARLVSGAEEMRAGVIAVEVELTPKAPNRLQGLMRAWRHAVGRRLVAEVHYHCEPGQTRRAVERAVAKTRTEGFIAIAEAVSR